MIETPTGMMTDDVFNKVLVSKVGSERISFDYLIHFLAQLETIGVLGILF